MYLIVFDWMRVVHNVWSVRDVRDMNMMPFFRIGVGGYHACLSRMRPGFESRIRNTFYSMLPPTAFVRRKLLHDSYNTVLSRCPLSKKGKRLVHCWIRAVSIPMPTTHKHSIATVNTVIYILYTFLQTGVVQKSFDNYQQPYLVWKHCLAEGYHYLQRILRSHLSLLMLQRT